MCGYPEHVPPGAAASQVDMLYADYIALLDPEKAQLVRDILLEHTISNMSATFEAVEQGVDLEDLKAIGTDEDEMLRGQLTPVLSEEELAEFATYSETLAERIVGQSPVLTSTPSPTTR